MAAQISNQTAVSVGKKRCTCVSSRQTVKLTSVWTVAVDICDSNVEESRSISDCDNIKSNRTETTRIQINVHVLAGIVAADGWNDGITCLATNHKAIIFADARPWPIQI